MDTLPTDPALTFPYSAIVTRPDLPTIYLGYQFGHQAEHASWSLHSDLTCTQHVEGTTISFGPTPAGVVPLEPVPTDTYQMAVLISEEDNDQPMGHNFPDLFSRLKAQEGYETASKIWSDACWWLDYLELPTDDI